MFYQTLKQAYRNTADTIPLCTISNGEASALLSSFKTTLRNPCKAERSLSPLNEKLNLRNLILHWVQL